MNATISCPHCHGVSSYQASPGQPVHCAYCHRAFSAPLLHSSAPSPDPFTIDDPSPIRATPFRAKKASAGKAGFLIGGFVGLLIAAAGIAVFFTLIHGTGTGKKEVALPAKAISGDKKSPPQEVDKLERSIGGLKTQLDWKQATIAERRNAISVFIKEKFPKATNGEILDVAEPWEWLLTDSINWSLSRGGTNAELEKSKLAYYLERKYERLMEPRRSIEDLAGELRREQTVVKQGEAARRELDLLMPKIDALEKDLRRP